MNKKIIAAVSGVLLLFGGAGAISNPQVDQTVIAKVKTVIKYDRTDETKSKKIEKQNTKTEKKIVSLDKKIAKLRKQLKKYSGKTVESVS